MSTQTKADFWLSRKILLGNKLVKTKLLKKHFLGHRPPLLQYLSTLLLFFIPSSINCTLVSIIVPHEVVGSWYLDFSTHLLRICSAWRFPLLIIFERKLGNSRKEMHSEFQSRIESFLNPATHEKLDG
jgi:hypothetical protein